MKTTTERPRGQGLPLAAAIDIGSNAMRLRIGGLTAEGRLDVVAQHREAVRLGHDAFTLGQLSPETIERSAAAFTAFRRLIDAHPVGALRAVGTSALRDAGNGRELIECIEAATGIRIEVISGEEEARLIHLALRHRLPLLGEHTALLIDIGGGSVEVSLCERGDIVAVESFPMGTVRLLELFTAQATGGADHRLLDEYIEAMLDKVGEAILGHHIDLCVGSGGNIESLAALGVQMLGNERADRLTHRDLRRIGKRLQRMGFAERIEALGLRPDRADVIVPACHVLTAVCGLAPEVDLHVPGTGLAEGVLIDLLGQHEPGGAEPGHQAIAWAHALARRFHADIEHAEHVARLAIQLFDETRTLHGLGDRERLVLHVAALIHEIGLSVRASGHHRHAHYLAMSLPMLGIAEGDRPLIAALLRYQRKRFPEAEHSPCRELGRKQQRRLYRLVVLLRLAIALDKERKGRIARVRLSREDEAWRLDFTGQGDCMLEIWALGKQAMFFETVFGHPLRLPALPITEASGD